jgi:uncharacterized protein (DUF4415 family)
LKSTSKTNWEKVEALTDEEIDTSDIAPLEAAFFANARLRLPKDKITALVSVDEETSEWFQAQGAKSRHLMSAALRIYAQAHRDTTR